MTERFRTDQEDYDREQEEFYKEFPKSQRKIVPPAVDHGRINKAWDSLLKEQNGLDLDDYTWPSSNSVERYIEPWVPPPADLLQLGVGSGREVHAARELGYRAEGVTLGEENVRFAKWRFGIDLFYGDHCSLPYANESFDVTYGGQIFEHCHSPYVFLFEVNRVIRPGGMLILEWPPFINTKEHSLEYSEDAHDFMQDETQDNIHHMCCWTPAQGRIMALRSGFKDVDVFVSSLAPPDKEEKGNWPSGYSRVTRKDPVYWSNISPGFILLKATRRSEEECPEYIKRLR